MANRFTSTGSGANTRTDGNGTLTFQSRTGGDGSVVCDEVLRELEDRAIVTIEAADEDSLLARVNDIETSRESDQKALSDRLDALESVQEAATENVQTLRDLVTTVNNLEAQLTASQNRVTALEAAAETP